jgi:hypothetical protein
VERIKGRKLENGHPVYFIKWKGYEDDKYDTWEPLSDLAGIEPDVAAYEARQRKEALDFAADLRARQKAKASADKVMAAAGSTSTTETTWDSVVEDLEPPVSESTSTSAAAAALAGKKSAPIWKRFKLDTSADAKLKHYIRQEMVGHGANAKKCGPVLNAAADPTGLWNHHAGKHKHAYQELKGYLNTETADMGVSITDQLQRTLTAPLFNDARKAECDVACARWIVKSARPLTMPETDEPFRKLIQILTRGAWVPPNRRNVTDNILKLSAQGQLRVQLWFEKW